MANSPLCNSVPNLRFGKRHCHCVQNDKSRFVYSFVQNLIKRHSVSTECLLFVLLISFRNLLFHTSNINLTKPSSLATHKISCPHRAKFWLRRPELLAVSATGGASGSRVLLHPQHMGIGKVRAEWTNRAEAKGKGHPKLYVYTARAVFVHSLSASNKKELCSNEQSSNFKYFKL